MFTGPEWINSYQVMEHIQLVLLVFFDKLLTLVVVEIQDMDCNTLEMACNTVAEASLVVVVVVASSSSLEEVVGMDLYNQVP